MISEAVVEATWQESARLTAAEARAAMSRLGKLQPALLAYVLAESEALRAAGELAVYIFFVATRMFYASGAKVRRVSLAAIRACADEVEQRLSALQGAHGAFLERAAVVLSSRQPHIFRYVVEAIMEAPESSIDPVILTPEEEGAVFLILATAVTALDKHGLSKSSA